MNELMQSPVLSGEDAQALTARLVDLLAWQTRKYTKGESTSVTVETAKELLASLRYTLAVVTEETGMPHKRRYFKPGLNKQSGSGLPSAKPRRIFETATMPTRSAASAITSSAMIYTFSHT